MAIGWRTSTRSSGDVEMLQQSVAGHAARRRGCSVEPAETEDAELAATSRLTSQPRGSWSEPGVEGTATMAPACASTPATGTTRRATPSGARP